MYKLVKDSEYGIFEIRQTKNDSGMKTYIIEHCYSGLSLDIVFLSTREEPTIYSDGFELSPLNAQFYSRLLSFTLAWIYHYKGD